MSISYLLNQVQNIVSQQKKKDSVDALNGALEGKFIHGTRNPDINYPTWITKRVAPGGFYAGAKYELKEGENNITILNEPEEMLKYANMIEYISHNLNGPEPLMIPTIAYLENNGKIKEANTLKELIRPYINNIRFYPITEEIMKTKKKPNVFASLETIYQFTKWCNDTYISKLKDEENLINMFKKKNDFKNDLINLFRETIIIVDKSEWPMQKVSQEWLEKAHQLYNANKWYLYDSFKRKRGSLYNLWSILQNIIPQQRIETEFPITRITGKEVRWIKIYLEANKNLKYYNIEHLQSKQQEAQNLLKYLTSINEQHLEKMHYEEIKEKYKDVEHVVFEKLNKCVLYSLEELKELGYIPSSETFVELAQPMEAFLQTIDFDFKEDITVEEHLKYLLYKSFKNMRSLLLLNLESQLKINEIPQYNVLCKVYKRDSKSSNSLILSKLLLSYYTEWFPGDIMPNRVVKMFYNLLKSEDKNLGLCEEIACDIFQRRFGEKYDTSLNIAKNNMINTLYSEYFELDDIYKNPLNLTGLSLTLKEKYYGNNNAYWTNSNGQQIHASMVLTTHNLTQLDRFLDNLDVLKVLRNITFKLLNLLGNNTIASLDCSQIGHCWRNFMYYVSKCSMCDISKYLNWIIIKVIWSNICGNKMEYLNIDEEQPLFIKNVINKSLKELSTNGQYVKFSNIWSELTGQNECDECKLLEKCLNYVKYLQPNRQNQRFFGLFIGPLINVSIKYHNIHKYLNIFNNKTIILGWIATGTKHDVCNKDVYETYYEDFKKSCVELCNLKETNKRHTNMFHLD